MSGGDMDLLKKLGQIRGCNTGTNHQCTVTFSPPVRPVKLTIARDFSRPALMARKMLGEFSEVPVGSLRELVGKGLI